MRFEVIVKNTDYAVVEVEAKSPNAAEDIVESMYIDGLIRWDYSDVQFEVKKWAIS